MKMVNDYATYYLDSNGLQHRVGLWFYDNITGKIWYFHGKCHRANGFSSEWDRFYDLYNREIKLNIGKLVI